MNPDDLDLSALTRNQLVSLQNRVEAELQNYEAKRKKEAMSEIERLAQEHGYSLAELIEGRTLSTRVHPPKYLNPDKPEETWSGRGRRPDWFREALDAGHTEDDMLIKPAKK